jgi:hypothetical protein
VSDVAPAVKQRRTHASRKRWTHLTVYFSRSLALSLLCPDPTVTRPPSRLPMQSTHSPPHTPLACPLQVQAASPDDCALWPPARRRAVRGSAQDRTHQPKPTNLDNSIPTHTFPQTTAHSSWLTFPLYPPLAELAHATAPKSTIRCTTCTCTCSCSCSCACSCACQV